MLKISQLNKCRIFGWGRAIGRQTRVRPSHIGAQGPGEQRAAAQGKLAVVPVTAVGAQMQNIQPELKVRGNGRARAKAWQPQSPGGLRELPLSTVPEVRIHEEEDKKESP